MNTIKKDFPIFATHPDMIYLDSASTLHKPQVVIDAVSSYLSTDYANIHRGKYDLSRKSEVLYEQARSTVVNFIWAYDESEVVWTSSSTDSANLLARSLIRSREIGPDHNIILSDLEHHANLLPRQMLAEHTGAQLRRVHIWVDGILDTDEVISLVDTNTKILALSLCSNVTGSIWEQEIKTLSTYINSQNPHPDPLPTTPRTSSLGEGECFHKPYIVVDASQAIAHFAVDVSDLGCDFCFFTGHKLGALTGTGVLWWKKKLLKKLTPGKVWGGAVERVTQDGVTYIWAPDSFEPGTPNIVWALSLAEAMRYIDSIWYDTIDQLERPLMQYCLEQFALLEQEGVIQLLWNKSDEDRVGVFSFVLSEWSVHELEQQMDRAGIALRTGTHCAHIYHQQWDLWVTCRISLWAYTEMRDVERFFDILRALAYHEDV